MTKYNHSFDVCFTIDTEQEDWETITNADMLRALEARVRSLRAEFIDQDALDLPVSDCFGYTDSYEI